MKNCVYACASWRQSGRAGVTSDFTSCSSERDFVSNALADGRQFRCFTVVDDMTRECPAIEVSASLPALRVIQVLDLWQPFVVSRAVSCATTGLSSRAELSISGRIIMA